MKDLQAGMKWREWVMRWDRMQERYLVARSERFAVIARLIRDTQTNPRVILDLGCGTGTLGLSLLKQLPRARVIGIDLDFTLLPLARARTRRFPKRAHFLQLDLRDGAWVDAAPHSVDAVVSATALHWLSKSQLKRLYHQISTLLKPGGIFLNADHAGSDSPRIQDSWTKHRAVVQHAQPTREADDWDGFWSAYLQCLGPKAQEARTRILGKWQGIESGLPLIWHFDELRRCGFSSVDCFWRHDCDAIYGGLKKE
ncbi:MAG: class I SAM-dependent methyltransferase [bacterium]